MSDMPPTTMVAEFCRSLSGRCSRDRKSVSRSSNEAAPNFWGKLVRKCLLQIGAHDEGHSNGAAPGPVFAARVSSVAHGSPASPTTGLARLERNRSVLQNCQNRSQRMLIWVISRLGRHLRSSLLLHKQLMQFASATHRVNPVYPFARSPNAGLDQRYQLVDRRWRNHPSAGVECDARHQVLLR
jgi:hypothetical protein